MEFEDNIDEMDMEMEIDINDAILIFVNSLKLYMEGINENNYNNEEFQRLNNFFTSNILKVKNPLVRQLGFVELNNNEQYRQAINKFYNALDECLRLLDENLLMDSYQEFSYASQYLYQISNYLERNNLMEL